MNSLRICAGVPEDVFAALRVTDDAESLAQFVHGCRAREITAEQLWQCVVRADQLRQARTGPERAIEDLVLFGLLLALGDDPFSELPLVAASITKRFCLPRNSASFRGCENCARNWPKPREKSCQDFFWKTVLTPFSLTFRW